MHNKHSTAKQAKKSRFSFLKRSIISKKDMGITSMLPTCTLKGGLNGRTISISNRGQNFTSIGIGTLLPQSDSDNLLERAAAFAAARKKLTTLTLPLPDNFIPSIQKYIIWCIEFHGILHVPYVRISAYLWNHLCLGNISISWIYPQNYIPTKLLQ